MTVYEPEIRECSHCGQTWPICKECNETWPCDDYKENHSEQQNEKQERWSNKHRGCPFHD